MDDIEDILAPEPRTDARHLESQEGTVAVKIVTRNVNGVIKSSKKPTEEVSTDADQEEQQPMPMPPQKKDNERRSSIGDLFEGVSSDDQSVSASSSGSCSSNSNSGSCCSSDNSSSESSAPKSASASSCSNGGVCACSAKATNREERKIDIEDLSMEVHSMSKQKKDERAAPEAPILPEGFLPGTQTIWVKTWGCSHNNSDSEYMAGQLAQYGYNVEIDGDGANAHLWLLNSCTVKGPSEGHFLTSARRAKQAGKHIVLAGCVPQAQKNIEELQDYSVIGVQQIDRVVEVVEETLKGHKVRLFSQRKTVVEPKEPGARKKKRKDGGARLNLPKIRKNPLVEIIPINTGCLNACTYCKTKHARGDLGSYDPEEIVERIVQVTTKEGVKEIWLTSEDTGAYGKDIGTDIAQLLFKITDVLPQGVMLRVGMTNPPYIMEHLESVAKVLNHPRVYSYLHVPVQAASDKVLEDMKRTYTCEEFCRVVDFLKLNAPGSQIATDIICGFPTESVEDWNQTMELVDRYRFSKLHVSQFYPRPGTPAARWKKLDTKEVKRRSREITRLFNSYTSYDTRVGTTCRVLVTETEHYKISLTPDNPELPEELTSASDRPIAIDAETNQTVDRFEHWVGHNKAYEPVVFLKDPNCSENFLGRIIEVRVLSTGKFHQFSVVTDTNPVQEVDMPASCKSSNRIGSKDTLSAALRRHVSHIASSRVALSLAVGSLCALFAIGAAAASRRRRTVNAAS